MMEDELVQRLADKLATNLYSSIINATSKESQYCSSKQCVQNNRNLCISEDQPLHPMCKCSFSLDFALINILRLRGLYGGTQSLNMFQTKFWLQFEHISRVEFSAQYDFSFADEVADDSRILVRFETLTHA